MLGVSARNGTLLDFVLPAELEAREPPEARGLARDQVRLLVSYRARRPHRARALRSTCREFLRAGDLLVVNVSATLPAALDATRQDGSEIALHLSTQLDGPLGRGGAQGRR